jgi:putative heme transporter
MLIYRLVSWIFISAIGWVVFFFMFRTEKDVDPDAPISEPTGDEPAEFSPDPDAIYAPEPTEDERAAPDPVPRREPESEP